MARLRTLKPGFFTNELLAELPPVGRLLFQGLWCWADREGRLEDRPRKIKAEVLPYDDCDADEILSLLEQRGFIVRYEHESKRYIQVVNFSKHQTPHIKEAASTIPPPTEHQTSTVQASDIPESSTSGLLGSGNLGAEKPPTVVAPVKPVAAPAPPVERSVVRAVPKPKEREKSWLERHPLFEPLIAIPEIGRPAGDAWSLYGKAVKALEELEATPEEIPRRAENYPRVMGSKEDGTPIPLTLTSFVKHWNLCGQAPRIQPKEGRNGELLGPTQDDRRRAEEKRRAEQETYRSALADLNGRRAGASGMV